MDFAGNQKDFDLFWVFQKEKLNVGVAETLLTHWKQPFISFAVE